MGEKGGHIADHKRTKIKEDVGQIRDEDYGADNDFAWSNTRSKKNDEDSDTSNKDDNPSGSGF